MDPELDMDEIYLMARGIMVQLTERVENPYNLVLLQRFQRTLVWLDAQAQRQADHPGTKKIVADWLTEVNRDISWAKGESKLESNDIDVEAIQKFYREQGL